MSLRDTLKSWLIPQSERKSIPSFDRLLTGMSRFNVASTFDDYAKVQRAQNLALTSSWVYSDINLIANRVASRGSDPFVVRPAAEGEEKILMHPYYELWQKPNSFMSGSFLKRYTTWWFWLMGNAYIFVSTSRQGIGLPEELWPLPASHIRPLPETMRWGQGLFRNRMVIDYESTVNGTTERLPGENIIHFRMPNTTDYWEGMSPLTAGMLGIQMDLAQGWWQRDFFAKENAIPSAVISVPAQTSPVDFERQRMMLKEQLDSGQRRLFTRSGDLSVEILSQTLDQMKITDSRKFNRDEIDRVFGIPEGFYNATSGDSRTAAEVAFSRNTIQPMLDYFVDQLNADLMPYYGPSDEIWLTSPDVVPQDRALAIQEYTIYAQDRTVNENRAEKGLDPVTDEPLADVPIRLLQFVAAAQAAEVAAENAAAMAENEPDVGSMEGTQDPEAMVDDLSGKTAYRDEIKRWQKVALGELKRKQVPGTKAFQSKIIPTEDLDAIRESLSTAQSSQEVKAIFEIALFQGTYP